MSEVLPPQAGYEIDSLREACGVVGVFAPTTEMPVASLLYNGLHALQHRGEDAAGIAVNDTQGYDFVAEKGLGLVSSAISAGGTLLDARSPDARCGVGHTRWSTSDAGDDPFAAVHPLIHGKFGTQTALVHNGHVENAPEAAAYFGVEVDDCRTDSAIIAKVLRTLQEKFDGDIHRAMSRLFPRLNGAFCILIAETVPNAQQPDNPSHHLHAVRDPWGFRPLVLGHLPNGGTVFASEEAGLRAMGAQVFREVAPGEIVTASDHGESSVQIIRNGGQRAPAPALCALEQVYLARPDGSLAGRSIYAAREEMGRWLAEEHPVDADVVIGIPSSGMLSAQGFAEQSGIPLKMGFWRDPYISRTFIQSTQQLREAMVRQKMAPLPEVLQGNRLVIVDDSIIRGTTMRVIARLLKMAGAAEVHLRIPSPQNKYPCYYGTDTGNPDHLLARKFTTVTHMAKYLGVDSLGFLSPEYLAEAIGSPMGALCMACMTGKYPTPQPLRVGRVLLGMPGVRLPADGS